MKKSQLSFAAACELLEKKEYIIWIGKTALYDVQGDSLWKYFDT